MEIFFWKNCFRFLSEQALEQATDYYPFGESFDNVNVAQNRYLYNGKELQDQTIGGTPFGWYDYGARFYDPELGRWHSVDPLAESYYDWSPNNYVLNNPLLFIDPNGLWVATSGGYTTDDPNDIARFLSYVKTENAVGSASPSIDQMNGFVQGEMNGGGRLSNGSYLVSEVSAVKENGKWKPEVESYHQAWVDIQRIVSGDKFYPFPIKGEPLMEPLDSWYEQLWYGTRTYNGWAVGYNGQCLGYMLNMDIAPTLGLSGGALKILGNLKAISNLTLREGVLLRGGKAGNLSVVAEWLHGLKIGEVASLAAKGDREAMTAVKILKQAAKKAQKY